MNENAWVYIAWIFERHFEKCEETKDRWMQMKIKWVMHELSGCGIEQEAKLWKFSVWAETESQEN